MNLQEQTPEQMETHAVLLMEDFIAALDEAYPRLKLIMDELEPLSNKYAATGVTLEDDGPFMTIVDTCAERAAKFAMCILEGKCE